MPLGIPLDYRLVRSSRMDLLFWPGAVQNCLSNLIAVLGTTCDAGDGSTTFNISDLRGRITAGEDEMGHRRRSDRLFWAVAKTLGGVLCAASHVLTIGQMASHNHEGASGSAGGHSHNLSYDAVGGTGETQRVGQGSPAFFSTIDTTDTAAVHLHSISSNGSD